MNFHKRAHADRGSIITMLRFLTENGDSSNTSQLTEILFLVKLKHYKERKTTFYKIKTLSSELQIKKNSCQTLGPEGKMVINDW